MSNHKLTCVVILRWILKYDKGIIPRVYCVLRSYTKRLVNSRLRNLFISCGHYCGFADILTPLREKDRHKHKFPWKPICNCIAERRASKRGHIYNSGVLLHCEKEIFIFSRSLSEVKKKILRKLADIYANEILNERPMQNRENPTSDAV